MVNNNPNRSQGRQQYKPEKRALPDSYVDTAEDVMSRNYNKITTSKIRNILSQISDIYNYENLSHDQKLAPESESKLKTARIRIVYEAGRDRKVEDFLREAKILDYMKDIGSNRQKFINFSHYLEALVAYHRFYGGKES